MALKWIKTYKHLVQCLAHNKHSTNVSYCYWDEKSPERHILNQVTPASNSWTLNPKTGNLTFACDRSIYYTSAQTVVSDVSNSLACSDICSWLKSEQRRKKGKLQAFHTPSLKCTRTRTSLSSPHPPDPHGPLPYPHSHSDCTHILCTAQGCTHSHACLCFHRCAQTLTRPVGTHNPAYMPPAPVPSWGLTLLQVLHYLDASQVTELPSARGWPGSSLEFQSGLSPSEPQFPRL